MSIPHDYYRYPDHPELHNRGEGRHYLEPDYHANLMDAQLPALSAIGRGPRGEGVYVGSVIDSDDEKRFTLNSTITGEPMFVSPNMVPPKVSFAQPNIDQIQSGEPAPIDITFKEGTTTKHQTVYIPAGATGSRIFTLPFNQVPDYDGSGRYAGRSTVAEIMSVFPNLYASMAKPKPGDVILFNLINPQAVMCLAVGIINSVGASTFETNAGEPTPDAVVNYAANLIIPVDAVFIDSDDTLSNA